MAERPDPFKRLGSEFDSSSGSTARIPAATVILLRNTTAGIETLMLRRNSKLEFAAGMWVFPGGRVDPGDHPTEIDESDPAAAERYLDAARFAATREAKEEADIDLQPHALVTFSHWEPPPITPKRFSTWFFVAEAPAGTAADVRIDHGEITDHAWLSPADALRRQFDLEIELAPPTWVTLFDLAACNSVTAALDLARARTPERFVTKIGESDGALVALWHGDAGYETGDATAAGPRHRLLMHDDGWRYDRTGNPKQSPD